MSEPTIKLASYFQNTTTNHGSLRAGMNHTRYIRFDEERTINGFELAFHRKYWWVLVYPKHLRVSIPDESRPGYWMVVYENEHLPKMDKLTISLERELCTRHLKVELLKHHGPSGHHQDIASNELVVDYDALDHFRLLEKGFSHETPVTPALSEKVWSPPIRFEPRLGSAEIPEGMVYKETSNELTFTNGHMMIGFSKLRPIITRLGWDSEHSGRESNFLFTQYKVPHEPACGPWLATYEGDVSADSLGGTMSVSGNTVLYENVHYPTLGITRNYRFTIGLDDVDLEIEQEVEQSVKAIECEALRWIWDLRTSIVATLANPYPIGKNGRCNFPAIIHAPNFGNLKVELLEGDPCRNFIKVDTWRERSISWTGIECGVTIAEDGELLLPAGKTSVRLRLSPGDISLKPEIGGGYELHPTFRRSWGSIFGFRPEYFGMSNNAASLNCHFVQHSYMDLACFTETNTDLELLRLCAYSVELALAGGAGYGDNREFFLDSDASLLMAAGSYQYKTRDQDWAHRNWSNMRDSAERLLARRTENGLIAAVKVSGNTGEWLWSSNWWDVIGFGHLDAFANAFAYRGLRQMQSAATWLGLHEEAREYEQAANRLQAAYFDCFYHTENGWLGGWRSRDGMLHDYAFTFVNGIACLYGLVPDEYVRPILNRLEAKREAIGYNHFHLGIPGNLIPITKGDYVESKNRPTRADGKDAYGTYQNGGATMNQSYFYIRALGLAEIPVVERINEQILDAFEEGSVVGGIHEGNEWRSWDGRRNGYEGLLSDQVYVLLAVAQNKGLVPDLPMIWQ